MVRAIECRQRLPAFRREPRDVGVSDVAKHFRGIRWFNRCVGCGGVTLDVTLSLLRQALCLHAGEQNRELERCHRS